MKSFLNLVFILSISSSNLYAFEPDLIDVKLEKFSVEVSKNCKKSCRALTAIKALNQKSYNKIESKVFGGRQPGLIVCLNLFKAKFKKHIDAQGNETLYCTFNDKSYISTGEFDKAISYF